MERELTEKLYRYFELRERTDITSSRQGGVGGPDTNDDIDEHQNDDVIYELVL